jgi:predicted MFS family arabinose efflux permease
VIVALGFFGSFFGIGLTWAASIFAVPMQDDLGWSRSEVFLAVSLRGWIGIVVSPFAGAYLDRGQGARVLALFGGSLNAVSLLLTSQVEQAWQFMALFGLMGGIAQTAQGGMGMAIIPKWFIARRASAVLISTLGGGLAALAFPLLLAPLNDGFGWRSGWVVIGVLALMFSALPALLVRRQPEDIGLLPDGVRHADGARRAEPEISFTRDEAMKTRTFWLLMAGVSLGSVACNGVPTNATNMFTDRGFALDTASGALVAYGLASISARVVWAKLVDNFHLRTVLLILSIYGALVMPVFLVIPDSFGKLALGYGALVGFFVGAYIPLHSLVWAAYFGRAHVGAISGAARPLGIIFLSSSPFLLASTRDLFGSYAVGLLLTSLALVLCAICLYFTRPNQLARSRDQSAAVAAPA